MMAENKHKLKFMPLFLIPMQMTLPAAFNLYCIMLSISQYATVLYCNRIYPQEDLELKDSAKKVNKIKVVTNKEEIEVPIQYQFATKGQDKQSK